MAALSCAKKLEINDFKASNTWINAFKKRYKIKSRIICGDECLVDETVLSNNFKEFITECDKFSEQDIFNADETALFYKCPAKNTLTIGLEDKISAKFSKERITILLTSNKLEKNFHQSSSVGLLNQGG